MRTPHAFNVQKIALILVMILMLAFSCILPANAVVSLSDVVVPSAPLITMKSATNGMVRVYLSSLGNPSVLDLTVLGNYSVSKTGEFLSDGARLKVGFSSSTGALTLTYGGQTYNMGKSFSLRRHSAQGANGIKIAQARESGNPYPGDLSFTAVAGSSGYTLYTVAHIYIENYLYGVLPYEMGNSSGIEALKAQAVAARTYTVRMMKSRASGMYDVKDTTSDQVYRGTPAGNANCVAAVDATKGIVLMHGSNYITTYYSASNGGQTETSRGSTAYAYLPVKDDPFDLANPSSTVKRCTIYGDLTGSLNQNALMSQIRTKTVAKLTQAGFGATAANTTLLSIKSVTPHTPKYAAPSRLYTKLDMTLEVRTVNAAGNAVTTQTTITFDIFTELESLLGLGIQSSSNELWSVARSGANFVVEARRYGHGMGMSQRGAMYMAKLGYTYDQILGFYYDGCNRVQHSFTNTILSADSSDEEVTVEPPADMEEEPESGCTASVVLVDNKSVLAIRAQKSHTAALVGTAPNGSIVRVLSNDGTWCMVRFGNICGYVSAASLSINGTPDGEEESVSSVLGFVTVTANDFVNIRSSGSMNASVIGTAPTGSVLTVFSRSGSWANVQYNAIVGYVNTNYVSAVSATYPQQDVTNGGNVAMVLGSNVPLRKSASTAAQAHTMLAGGAQLTVLSDDGTWCRVRYGSVEGYVLSTEIIYSDAFVDLPDLPAPDDGTSDDETDDGESDDGESDQPPADDGPSDAVDPVYATVTTANGSLNMRAQPSAGSRVITTIPRGATVTVTDRGDVWCGVYYNGYSGFAMTLYLAFDDEGGDVETPSPGDTAIVTTQSGSLNLRMSPRSGSDIITRIPQYATVAVDRYGAEWCAVSWQGYSGYVMTIFLTFADGEMPLPPTVDEPDLPPEEDVEDPEEEIVPDDAPQDAVYARVSTASGSLNLRRDPLGTSPVLTRIPKGTTIVIERRMTAWSRTHYAGQTGYVMNSYLTFLGDVPDPDYDETAVVTTVSGSLNLRSEPSVNSGLIARIPQYATVGVAQHGDTWCYVVYDGMAGYVMTRYLTFGAYEPPQDEETLPPDGNEQAIAFVYTASGSLNLRQSPSATARVLTTIPRNAAVSVLNKGDTWCAVQYGIHSGYVMTTFLRFEDMDFDDTADVPVPDDGGATDAWVLTPSGSLNLRAAPNGGAQVITTIPRLAKVSLWQAGDQWCRVSYRGQHGYVMSAYLTDEEPATAAGAAPATPSYGAVVDYASLDPTLEVPDDALFAMVTPYAGSEDTPLYELCSRASMQVDVLPAGAEVEIILRGSEWCRVQYLDVQGYCPTRELDVIQ